MQVGKLSSSSISHSSDIYDVVLCSSIHFILIHIYAN